MIKKYKMTRIVRSVDAIQLKENNIMEVARFLDSGYFSANVKPDRTNNIQGVSFHIEQKGKNIEDADWELDLDFGDYAVIIDKEIEGYSEKEFKLLFEEEN